MKITNFEVLVFDFDGVIVDSVHIKEQGFRELYKDAGTEIQNKVGEFHLANGGMDRISKIAHIEKKFFEHTPPDEFLMKKADEFSQIVKKKVIDSREIPGAIAFVKKYNSKIPCVINSATPTRELVEIIAAKGWKKHFERILGSPEPKDNNLRAIINDYQVSPSSILFFGDAISDYNAAKKNHVNFCCVSFRASAEVIAATRNQYQISNFLKLIG